MDKLKSSLYGILSIALCAALYCIPCPAQTLLRQLPQHPFIDYGKNRIVYPGDSARMERLYNKLDSLMVFGQGDISVLHIGGSHVQADVFSNRMRMNLATLGPGNGAERGVLFPYRMARTNGPGSYRIAYTGQWETRKNVGREDGCALGLTGYIATTDDPLASLSVKLNKDIAGFWQFNTLRIVGSCTDSAFVPQLTVEGEHVGGEYLPSEECYIYHLPAYTDSVHIEFQGLKKESVTFRLSALIPENDLTGITYHSVGVNGAAVPSWLRCGNFEKELNLVKPDLVIFGIGINDANVPYGQFDTTAFKNNYNDLIERIERVSPGCALLFITNNDCCYRVSHRSRIPNKNGPLVEKAFFSIAREHGGAVWNMFDIMGGLGSMSLWQKAGLARPDKVHFTPEGYELLGDMLYNAIVLDYLYK